MQEEEEDEEEMWGGQGSEANSRLLFVRHSQEAVSSCAVKPKSTFWSTEAENRPFPKERRRPAQISGRCLFPFRYHLLPSSTGRTRARSRARICIPTLSKLTAGSFDDKDAWNSF